MSVIAPTGSPGAILDRGTIEQNTLAHLREWMIPYLAQQERDHGLAKRFIAAPKSFDVVTEFKRFPEDQMPFIAVVSTGIDTGKGIHREGDGYVTMWWAIAVGAIVAARDASKAKALAGYYGAALRGIMLQMPQLGGWANDTEQGDERYDDFPRSEERQLAAVRLGFTIEVSGVMNLYQGFRSQEGEFVVPTDPYGDTVDYPTVITPSVDVELEPITDGGS